MSDTLCNRCSNTLEVYSDDQYFCPQCNLLTVISREVSEPKLSSMYRADGKQTSVDAATTIKPHVKGLKQQIIRLLKINKQGLMVWQIALLLDREKPSISPRLSELVEDGYAVEAGVGVSNNGQKATIYKYFTYTSAYGKVTI